MNLVAVFLTGLLAGGLSCLAVQGGLLATTIAQSPSSAEATEGQGKKNFLPILYFLGAKLVAYTILGFFLGLLGSALQLSIQTQAILQILVAIFMIGTALNLLNIHPIFRYFALSPPRFLTRIIRDQSKSRNFFAPAILGTFTIFIPCGTTQAMMALAIASGNPISGTLIMFAFVLGTSPVFFTLGYLATRLGEAMKSRFMFLSAVVIIGLAIVNLNGAATLIWGFSLGDLGRDAWCTVTFCKSNAQTIDSGATVSEATINIGPGGYSPNQITVRAGSAVTLKLVNGGGGGCAASFTIPSLGIRKVVQVGSTETIAFTAPSNPGQVQFMCSMGMYRGVINVI